MILPDMISVVVFQFGYVVLAGFFVRLSRRGGRSFDTLSFSVLDFSDDKSNIYSSERNTVGDMGELIRSQKLLVNVRKVS